MNRIAGILTFDQTPVNAMDIQRMIRPMDVRGERGQRIFLEGQVGLACAQPDERSVKHSFSEDRDKGLAISFDGRIDNRPDLVALLRSLLMDQPSPVRDQELVLAAYQKWGSACAAHLIGDFAFAVWDHHANRLLCARDHFGVKPFYYFSSQESFVFASSPQAILASGRVPAAIHEERIADFLVNPLEGVDKTSTFYKDVFRLPPAHRLIVEGGQITLQRYWELNPDAPAGFRADEDYVEAFRELFGEAVRCRLRDLCAPASMLSGGMDSSAIAAAGRNVLAEEGKRLHVLAFISGCPDPNRETSHIFSVLDRQNLQSHPISQIELSEWMDELVKAIERQGEPFDCLMNLNRAVYLHAREHGMGALLDGIDGDVLLSGSGHLAQLWRQRAYRTLLGETLKADGLTAEYKTGRRELRDSFLSAITPFAPKWYRDLRQPVRNRKALQSAIRDTIVDPGFAAWSRVGERLQALDSHSPRLRSFRQVEAHKVALDHPFLTVGLERYERVASSFGVEARHPFTDVRLAGFCLALPWHLKTHHGWTKMILRRAMEPDLPPEVIWRRDKDSLMWEVNRSILKARADYFYRLTSDARDDLKPYIDTQKLMTFWDGYLMFGDETHAESLWSGVALAMWLCNQKNVIGSFMRL